VANIGRVAGGGTTATPPLAVNAASPAEERTNATTLVENGIPELMVLKSVMGPMEVEGLFPMATLIVFAYGADQ